MTWKQKVIKTLTPILLPIVKLYWRIFQPKTYGVKVVVESEKGEVLIVRHSYGSGIKTFPGGSMKKGEDPTQAAVREVKEELDVDLIDPVVLGSFVSTREGKIDTVYVVRGKTAGQTVTPAPFEIASFSWDQPDAIDEFGHVGSHALEMYQEFQRIKPHNPQNASIS